MNQINVSLKNQSSSSPTFFFSATIPTKAPASSIAAKSSGSAAKSSPLPAAPPAKPLPPSPSRPSLAATLATPETEPVQAAMPAVGGHTLGGARRPPTGKRFQIIQLLKRFLF